MKALHVIPSVSLRDGGPSRAITDIERALRVRGIEVTTVTTADADDAKAMAFEYGVPVETAGVTRWYFPRQTAFYKVSLPLASWLRRNIVVFDVVHAHALFSFAPIAAAIIARRAGVPYVLRPLGVLNRYGMAERHRSLKRLSLAFLERPLVEDASAVHFTSRAEQTEAALLNLKLCGVVIPLGIAQGAIVRQGGSGDADDPDRQALLFLSRIDPKKNLENVLRALSLLASRHSRLSLDVVGDGDPTYVQGLKSLAAALGIAGRVRWQGYLDGQAKDEIIAKATAFVLPSYSENFGIAVVEALAAGLPCIVSREVAVSEEIDAAGAGIVTGTDPDSIAAAIGQLLADKERLAVCGSAARKLAANEFSLSAMGERLEALYRDVSHPLRRQQAVAFC